MPLGSTSSPQFTGQYIIEFFKSYSTGSTFIPTVNLGGGGTFTPQIGDMTEAEYESAVQQFVDEMTDLGFTVNATKLFAAQAVLTPTP